MPQQEYIIEYKKTTVVRGVDCRSFNSQREAEEWAEANNDSTSVMWDTFDVDNNEKQIVTNVRLSRRY